MAAPPSSAGPPMPPPPPHPQWLQASEINRALHEYRRGRLSRKELVKAMEAHREEFFRDDPRDGNLVHALIRRGHTKSLLQVILPNHPDVVLATERVIRPHSPQPPPTRSAHATVAPNGASTASSSSSSSSAGSGIGAGMVHPLMEDDGQDGDAAETVTLLRRAVERKDRAVVDGIVRAIKLVLDRSVECADPPERREVLLTTLLRVADWRLALLEYPTLLDDSAVKGLFELHPSSPGVIAAVDEGDFRANLAHGELRSLGAEQAFPENFWADSYLRRRRPPTLLSREGLKLLSSPRGGGSGGHHPLTSRHPTLNALSPTGQSTQPLLLHRAATAASIDQGSVGEGMGQGHVYHEMITETSGVEVEASLVAFPDALRAGDELSLLRLCCDLYERTGKAWLFELETVAIILKYKWNAFGRPIYKLLLALSLLLAVNYSLASAYCLPLLQSTVRWKRQSGLAWQALLLANAFPLIVQEYWQWHLQGTRAYFRKGDNALDCLTLLLLHASVALRFFAHELVADQALRSAYHLLSSLAALLLWFKLLIYLRGFHETGPLIRMIYQIVIDTRYFLVVLAISIIGFGNCLYLIFQEDIEREDAAGTDSPIRTSYGNLYHSFLVLFAALNSNLDYNPFNASRFRVLASVVYVLAVVFNTTILLNLLIALLGDSYDKIQENAVAQGRYEQAISVLEIEQMLPQRIRENPRFFPRWVQILRPKLSPGDAALAADTETQQWSGRLRQIYKKIEASERRIAHEIDGVGTQLELMERRVMGLPLVSPGRTADREVPPTDAPTSAGSSSAAGPFPTEGIGSGASSPFPPQPSPSPSNTASGCSPGLVHFAATVPTTTTASGGGTRTPLSPSGSFAAAAAATSARSLGTRLSRLEESVAAIDGKMDRLMRLVAAMALSDGDRAAAASAAPASLLLLPPSPSPPEDDGDGGQEGEGGEGAGIAR